ncbi:MAG: hypothetical protein KDD48_04090, partial [Bdellovibrionales bacterium]|nr:hypothetical protein [Bdellovibrionales bacterium]
MALRLAWIFLSVIFLLVRFQNAPGVLTPKGMYPSGTDAYCRLHRITSMIDEGKPYPLNDP